MSSTTIFSSAPSPVTEDNIWGLPKRKFLLLGSLVVYVVPSIVGIFAPRWLTLNWGLIAFFGSIVHFILYNLKTVNPDEWGLVIFFGRILYQASEGWVSVPAPFCRLERIPKGFMRVEFGSPFTDQDGKPLEKDPDEGRKDVDIIIRQPFRPNFLTLDSLEKRLGSEESLPEEAYDLPKAYRLPNITREVVKKFGGDSMHKAITPNLQIFFIIGVKDAAIFYRLVKGRTVEDKLMNVAYMIADQGKHAILEVAGKISFGIFRMYQGSVNRRLRYRVEQILGEEHTRRSKPGTEKRRKEEEHHPYLGINLVSIAMKEPGLPYHVNIALSLGVAAGYEKARTIALSEGEKEKRTNEGLGDAAAKEADLKAIAAGAEAMARVAETPEGELALRLRAAENSIKGSNSTLFPMDFSGLVGAVTTIKNIATGSQPSSKKTD